VPSFFLITFWTFFYGVFVHFSTKGNKPTTTTFGGKYMSKTLQEVEGGGGKGDFPRWFLCIAFFAVSHGMQFEPRNLLELIRNCKPESLTRGWRWTNQVRRTRALAFSLCGCAKTAVRR
jgi:hypothetical protein